MAVKRFYLLDVTRGIAAFSVVLWHYQHFYFDGPGHLSDNFVREAQPFYSSLWLFYLEGSRGVYLFFVLSGFVFFAQYAEKIANQSIGPIRFFVWRFSRLYPLHFATLIFVFALQIVAKDVYGHYAVYHCNGFARGVLSATFLTDWLPEKYVCSTLNGPTWSLSVEVFLYAIFFIVGVTLLRRYNRFLVVGAIIALGLLVYGASGYHLLGEPTVCFFSGGMAYLVWKEAHRVGGHARLAWVAVTTSVAACTFISCVAVWNAVLDTILFPALVVALASTQSLAPRIGYSVRSIGDISYSVYLLHFPLQLAIIVTTAILNVEVDFNDWRSWLVFFSTLILLSFASYYAFEVRAQQAMRDAFTRNAKQFEHAKNM